MENNEKQAILLELLDQLRARHSWCGETHLQKAVYFLQQMAAVPIGYEFVLYKHGPFSFELKDEISAMVGDDTLKVVPQRFPYGPKLEEGSFAPVTKVQCDDAVKNYSEQIRQVSEKLGGKNVGDLERLATALYAIKECSELADDNSRAKQITQWKPHVEHDDALKALQTVNSWLSANYSTSARV